MDTSPWPTKENIVVKAPSMITNPCLKPTNNLERKITKAHKEESIVNCPRCNSTNTKFCYYNNYSLTQPRYFCKTCRRYWTQGGSLRNIPVGGGSRKNNNNNKRSNLSSSKSSKIDDFSQNPSRNIYHQAQDLNLAFPITTTPAGKTTTTTTCRDDDHQAISAIEVINGISSRGLGNSYMPLINNGTQDHSIYTNGFLPMLHGGGFSKEPMVTSLNFSLDQGLHHQHGGATTTTNSSTTNNNGRMLFPFEDLKQQMISSTSHDQQIRDLNIGDSTGYWTGMLGGGNGGGGGGSW